MSIDENRNKFKLYNNRDKNGIPKLVYYENAGNVISAIALKKKLNKWDKVWMNILIETFNPERKDLYKCNKFIEDFPEYSASCNNRELTL